MVTGGESDRLLGKAIEVEAIGDSGFCLGLAGEWRFWGAAGGEKEAKGGENLKRRREVGHRSEHFDDQAKGLGGWQLLMRSHW